jgi:glucosamine-6-phosphate deaminase
VRVEPQVFADADALGRSLARTIADGIAATPVGGRYLLGCPGGRSPRSTYRALADEVAHRRLDLTPLVVVMMDEYVDVDESTGRARGVDPRAPHSCARFGRDEIVAPLNAAAGPGRGVTPDRLWLPDPAQPQRYDRQLSDRGGMDLFVLATGSGDGHVGFNPPGTDASTHTRVVPLAESTRRDNLRTFPSFGDDLARVPRFGVTVGIDTIRRSAKSAVLIAHGAEKVDAVRRLSAASAYDPQWPATVLADCAAPRLFVDEAAVAGVDVACEPDRATTMS